MPLRARELVFRAICGRRGRLRRRDDAANATLSSLSYESEAQRLRFSTRCGWILQYDGQLSQPGPLPRGAGIAVRRATRAVRRVGQVRRLVRPRPQVLRHALHRLVQVSIAAALRHRFNIIFYCVVDNGPEIDRFTATCYSLIHPSDIKTSAFGKISFTGPIPRR